MYVAMTCVFLYQQHDHSCVSGTWSFIKNHEKNLVKDYKTLLQESLQKEHQVYPEYYLVSTDGPPHLPSFVVECYIQVYDMRTTGEGQSVKAAEQSAAMKAYNAIVGNG